MSFVVRKTYYFDAPGPENTGDCARFALERARELGLSRVVVASTSGKTAVTFHEVLKGSSLNLLIIKY